MYQSCPKICFVIQTLVLEKIRSGELLYEALQKQKIERQRKRKSDMNKSNVSILRTKKQSLHGGYERCVKSIPYSLHKQTHEKNMFICFLQKRKKWYTQKMKKKKKKFQTNKSKTMFLNNPLWVVWSSFLKRKFKTCIKKHVLKKVLKNNTHAFYNREI